jgi:hypothetical protein
MSFTSIRALKACGPTVGTTTQTNLAIELDWELSHPVSNNGWENWYFKNMFTRGPKLSVPIYLRSIHTILVFKGMEVGSFHLTWGPKSSIPSPKYNTYAYMTRLFGGEAQDLC